MSHDVFICHSSKDKSSADAACAVLEREGLRCWIAPRDIVAGREWSEAIVNAIEDARVFVLIFSRHANESNHIKREVELAVKRGIPIIPVRIEEVQPSRSLEYYISTQHWMDAITPPLERHLETLSKSIKILIGAAAPEPQPSGPLTDTQTPVDVKPVPTQPPRRKASWRRWVLPASIAGVAIAALTIAVTLWPKPPHIIAKPWRITEIGKISVGTDRPPIEACEIKNWDGIKRYQRARAQITSRNDVEGIFVQFWSYDPKYASERPARDWVKMVSTRLVNVGHGYDEFLRKSDKPCRSARVIIYDSTEREGFRGAGLLFPCKTPCAPLLLWEEFAEKHIPDENPMKPAHFFYVERLPPQQPSN